MHAFRFFASQMVCYSYLSLNPLACHLLRQQVLVSQSSVLIFLIPVSFSVILLTTYNTIFEAIIPFAVHLLIFFPTSQRRGNQH